MKLADILVHLDDTEQAMTRLDLAIDLARRHEAHLFGLSVVDIVPLPTSIVADHGGLVASGWLVELQAELDAAADRVGAIFKDRVASEGVAGEWRKVPGPLLETMVVHARYADMTILGQRTPDDLRAQGGSQLIEEVLFSSGRPVLVVPYAGRFRTVGRNVLIGWNASREAARAVNDALPLIGKAERITVLIADSPRGWSSDGNAATAIAQHLARHGVKATTSQTVPGTLDAGDILLNHASDIDADLLVMGAYGHSRVRELVLGGATRSILDHATLPVFMSR